MHHYCKSFVLKTLKIVYIKFSPPQKYGKIKCSFYFIHIKIEMQSFRKVMHKRKLVKSLLISYSDILYISQCNPSNAMPYFIGKKNTLNYKTYSYHHKSSQKNKKIQFVKIPSKRKNVENKCFTI